ncbi:response regulator containing a CheY-like receiver domain and a GGDEF domain [Alteromonas mediterranea 615]|uniref:Response regulator containing a CheY-like receiver domain and a GGDEF domain n=1 Tax=Alteromonas mediterranea 615 TaxID=1300253 RepID=S5APZ2_9ALTE|nr:response regulator containing a CheY-like receiver domain and a GGDEF domain [Alteromonas mediterranea 615]
MSIDNVNLFNLLENTHIGVVIHNESGAVEYANPAALAILNLNIEQLKEKNLDVDAWEFIDMQNRTVPYSELPISKVLNAGSAINEQILGTTHHETGQITWLSVNAYSEKYEVNGKTPSFVVVYFVDITKKVNNFSYKDIVQNAQDMILVTEAKNIDAPLSPKIFYANEALCRHTEYTLEELIGETPRIFQGTLTDKEATQRIRQALLEHRPCTETLLNYTKTGKPFWVQMNIFPLTNDYGEVTHFAAVQRDVSETKFQTEQLDKRNAELKRIKDNLEQLVNNRTRELRSANLKLEKLAYVDALTHIPNRRAFLDSLKKFLHLACRNKQAILVGIADVDHFKSINDQFGHAFGDDVLVTVAQTLQKLFRQEDCIGRIGGEEFAFCMSLPTPGAANQLLERFRETICHLHTTQPILKGRNVTVSIGAVYTQKTENTEIKALLKAADDALYKAKNSGRNAVECTLDVDVLVTPKLVKECN